MSGLEDLRARLELAERLTPTQTVQKALVEAEWAIYSGYPKPKDALLRITQILNSCSYIQRERA